MNMTHYMQLLAENQPWNLIIFMAIPVILAETIAITELYLLYTRNYNSPIHTLNRAASIAVGLYFAGVFVYLLTTAVIPLTKTGSWRGPADVIAVLSYLAGVVPLGALALIDLKLIARDRDDHQRMALHAVFVAIFLVVAHVAMVFGMLDPTILGGAGGGHAGH